jgi:beta-lactamase regulating signal transducer with metallopeptidase domain
MKFAIKKSVAIVFILGIIALNLTLFVMYRIFSDFSSQGNSIDQNNQKQKTSEKKQMDKS